MGFTRRVLVFIHQEFGREKGISLVISSKLEQIFGKLSKDGHSLIPHRQDAPEFLTANL